VNPRGLRTANTRLCGTPGCMHVDFHSGAHSNESLSLQHPRSTPDHSRPAGNAVGSRGLNPANTRLCGTPGCMHVDFHSGPHSNESLSLQHPRSTPGHSRPAGNAVGSRGLNSANTRLCGTPGCMHADFHPGAHSNESLSPKRPGERAPSEETRPDDDVYGGVAKLVHRCEFAISCRHSADRSPNKRILYLETGAGKTTEELLKHGFTQSDLHPCNISRTELNSILAKYPDVVVEHGNILHIFKEQQWLGVWFDLETSLLRTELPGQPWDHNRVPEFRRAAVCAISLSHRRVEGTTEQFAIELQSLMEKDVRYVTSPQMARAYSGRSNKQNMVFGLSHYTERTSASTRLSG